LLVPFAQDLKEARFGEQILGCSEQEVAYAAGFFDGEGSVSLCKYVEKQSKYPYHHRLRICIPNTDFAVIDWLAETFGGTSKTRKKRGNRKAQKVWTLNGPKASVFLQQVLPYLKVKSPAALLAIDFQSKRYGNPRMKGISQEEWNRRDSLYWELKSLNYRGQGKNGTHS
jgi:hypothetical protein